MPRLAEAWRALWLAQGARPDLGPDWAEALIVGHAVDRAELLLAVGHDASGELAWVWPLRRQRVRGGQHGTQVVLHQQRGQLGGRAGMLGQPGAEGLGRGEVDRFGHDVRILDRRLPSAPP